MTFKLKKTNLILFTGFVWLFAGFLLLHRAYSWINLLTDIQLLSSIIIAIVLAVIKTYFIFHTLTIRNINRILAFKNEYISILKFHALKDQLLIVVMILTGALLRHTPFIPKYFLMPIYIGIGLAMLFSASLYVFYLLKPAFMLEIKNRDN